MPPDFNASERQPDLSFYDLNSAATARDPPPCGDRAARRDGPSPDEVIAAFRADAAAAGVAIPADIVLGKLARCDSTGRNGEGDAAYLLHVDSFPNGWFQNWQTGGPVKWRWSGERPRVSRAKLHDIAKANLEAKRERERLRAAAVEKARADWDTFDKDDVEVNAGYIVNKGLRSAHGARFTRNYATVVPMRDAEGAICNLQYIAPDGSKRFVKDAPVTGLRHTIGDAESCGGFLVGEGFATVASVVEATNSSKIAGVVAFNAGNLFMVATSLRARYPDKHIMLLADNDRNTEGNPGLTKARAAAEAVGGWLVAPSFSEVHPAATDFDDVRRLYGPEEVKRQINGARPVAVSQIMPPEEPADPLVGEVLMTPEEVRQVLLRLTKDSASGDIRRAIEMMAKARLDPLDHGPFLSIIKDKTGQKIPALNAALREELARLAPIESQSTALAAAEPWHAALIRDDEDQPRSIMANVAIIAQCHHAWANVLALDEFTGFVMLRSPPPWLDDDERDAFKERPLTDADIRAATLWLQSGVGINAASHIVFEGMQAAAERVRYDPPKEYLEHCGRNWDGKPRVDNLFLDYFHAEVPRDDRDRITAYYKAIGSGSMIGAVARIVDPGCKNDTTPNLYGDQSIGKSTAVETLFSPWYTDDLAEMGSKDSQLQIAGVWGVEVGEMVAARRDTDRTKAYISRRIDRYRPPYGRTPITQPRRCVFWGTTNRDVFLFDETGNRRSWGVACGTIDVARLRADRDQLWGEAVVRHRNGERWWLTDPEIIKTAAEVQYSFTEEDAWHAKVVEYLVDKISISIDALLGPDCIGILIQDRTQAQANRVAKILRSIGWKRKQRRVAGKLAWLYLSPDHPDLVTDTGGR